MENRISVSYHGRLWSLPGSAMHDALADTAAELVAEGENRVSAQLYSGHGLVTGHYRRSVNGRMLGSLHGEVHDSRVVYGPWLEGTTSRNQSTRFKGYAMFRQAYQDLQRLKVALLQKRLRRLFD